MMDDQLGQQIGAWRRGVSAALVSEVTRSFDDYAEVYRRMVKDLNRDWKRELEKLAAEDVVTLVVVGALHLVGENSLIRMLRDRGRRVERWRPDD